PLVVARGQIAQLAADVELATAEERPLEAERIAGAARGRLERHVTRDVGVVELAMVEDRRAEAERRHEAIDGGEPVFAVAKIGHQLEAAGRFGEADEENPLAVAVHEIERAAALARRLLDLAAVEERGPALEDSPRADRAARRPQ